ncbi:MAG: ATP-binding cassette domain-containing protein [Caldilinea sp.]
MRGRQSWTGLHHSSGRLSATPIDILKKPRREYAQQAEDLLRLVGLWDFRDQYPSVLSGGMQQRASLCRSLIHDPSLLVMDEPFGALNAFTRDEMNLELQRVWSQRRKTVLFITHSIQEAIFLSDRIVVLSTRPSKVDSVFTIDLSRPRSLDVRYSEAFGRYTEQIHERIMQARGVQRELSQGEMAWIIEQSLKTQHHHRALSGDRSALSAASLTCSPPRPSLMTISLSTVNSRPSSSAVSPTGDLCSGFSLKQNLLTTRAATATMFSVVV